MKSKMPNNKVVTIFLDIDDDSLISRLKKRGDDEGAIMQRILIAHEERNAKGKCDYALMADNVEKTANIIHLLV